jgi:hypothetical protein
MMVGNSLFINRFFPEMDEILGGFSRKINPYESTGYEHFPGFPETEICPYMTDLENLENRWKTGIRNSLIYIGKLVAKFIFQTFQFLSSSQPQLFQKCGSLLRECRFWNKGRRVEVRKNKDKNQGVLNADS